MTSLPIAGDAVFGAIRRFYDRLDGVRELLSDGARFDGDRLEVEFV
jgi:hypothetical protein